MRPTSVVVFVTLVAACSSSAARTQRLPPTTAARKATITTSSSLASTTSTTQKVTIGHTYQVGSFSRSGPWTVEVSDNHVTRDTVIPFQRRVYRSFDGRHWVELPPAPAFARFVDAMHGWAVGPDPKNLDPDNTMLWSTTDGGLHYQPLGFVFGGLHHAGDDGQVQFIDPKHGFATTSTLVATGWSVRRTSDGGRTWHAVSSDEDFVAPFGPPVKFEFVSPTEGYASGYTPTGRGAASSADVYRTLDGGSTWQRIGLDFSGQHGAGLPTLIDDFILVPVLRVEPSGSRVELYEGRRDDIERPWRRVWSVDVAVRAPVGWPGVLQPIAALKTEDDGLVTVWNKVFTGVRQDQRVDRVPPSGSVYSLIASSSEIFAASYNDGVFVSSDLGETWQRVDLPSG
jgi:hypothetical protein